MANPSRDEQSRVRINLTAQKLQHAGETLAARQATTGAQTGNVPPWPGSEDLDFHGTLGAICLWARAQTLGQVAGAQQHATRARFDCADL